jgi:serine/threonine protein kinase
MMDVMLLFLLSATSLHTNVNVNAFAFPPITEHVRKIHATIHKPTRTSTSTSTSTSTHKFMAPIDDSPLDFDDDDFFEDDEDALLFSQITQKQQKDLSGCSTRQFNLGYDLIVSDYVGSLGFEEVTDWEYYQPSLVNNERRVVEPPPFDPNQPKRTREKSGSVVRIFRGEISGRLGSMVRSKGMDPRIMLKEFSGSMAIDLAKAELESLSRMQSNLCAELNEGARNGDWASSASMRYVEGRVNGSTKTDDENLMKWMEILSSKGGVPYVATLGELNLLEFFENIEEGNVQNEWYRALGVKAPKPGSLWIVYEYTGLTTLSRYAEPALKRWFNLPPQKGFWGKATLPALPPWKERSRYVKAMLRGSLEGLVTIHENGFTHRSIGRNSIIISSVGQDKQEASSVLATVPQRLKMKITDFGFSGRIVDSSNDEEFRRRARAFDLDIIEGSSALESKCFAIAEDLHALGFVFIGLLLSSLAEIPRQEFQMPPTDEDSLQRLMSDIFDKDMDEFRDYCEAEDIWSSVVGLLDENDSEGWRVLEQMCFARENVVDNLRSGQILTAEGVLSSPFFKKI